MMEATTMAHANEFPTVNQGSDGRVIIEMSNADGASTSRKQEDDVTMEMEDMMSNTDVAPTIRQQVDDDIMEMSNADGASTSRKQEDDVTMEMEDMMSNTDVAPTIRLQVDDDIMEMENMISDTDGVITRIPKVPQGHGYGVRDAYEPSIISIGPYHRGKPRLQPMEMLKRKCFDRLNKDGSGTKYSLEECIHKVNPEEMKAKSYYSENTGELDSKEFVEMMLFDACFIIEYSICVEDGTLSELVNNRIWMDIAICNDLLLLENQLPFFVVKHIYQIFIDDQFDKLMGLVERFCRHVSPINTYELSSGGESVHHLLAQHLLHIYHWYLFSSTKKDEKEKEDREKTSRTKLFRPEKPICTIRSATFLQEAGIEFRKKMKATTSIMAPGFRNGVMEITPLFIDAFTVYQFRNLIALEKSDPHMEPQAIAIAQFMDYIINTSKDVALLRKKGIMEHALGSDEEIATIFNQLTSGTLEYRTPELERMYKDVDGYCKTKRHRWRKIFMRDYFGSPWAAISLVAAVILLSLTFLQTFFSMYGYFKPPSAT